MPSVLHTWVECRSFRMQGALLSAIRGCDNVPKDDPSKALIRAMRPLILKSACERPNSFIDFVDSEELERRMRAFLENFDHYPVHFVLHLLHAAEIIGYRCPFKGGALWGMFYNDLCYKMHLRPEALHELEERLK